MATIVSWPFEEMIISFVITNSRQQAGGSARGRPACLPKLVRESAHADVEHQPEPGERGDHRRTSVAHERQRETFYGRQSSRHGDVVDHLEGEAGQYAEHEIGAEAIFGQT